jgi:hypothetical protein
MLAWVVPNSNQAFRVSTSSGECPIVAGPYASLFQSIPQPGFIELRRSDMDHGVTFNRSTMMTSIH